MRWSERGFDHLLCLRVAWVNGKLDQLFVDPGGRLLSAAWPPERSDTPDKTSPENDCGSKEREPSRSIRSSVPPFDAAGGSSQTGDLAAETRSGSVKGELVRFSVSRAYLTRHEEDA
jgi:hypothetical protein